MILKLKFLCTNEGKSKTNGVMGKIDWMGEMEDEMDNEKKISV